MEGKKVVIWVDDIPNEVTVWSRETLHNGETTECSWHAEEEGEE